MKRVQLNSPILLVYLLLALLILAVQGFTGYKSAHAQIQPVLVQVESATVEAGNTASVNVIIHEGTNFVGAMGIEITYDPSAIDVTACEVGPLSNDISGACNVDFGPNTIRVSAANTADFPVPNNSFTLMTLTITGIAPGTNSLTVSSVDTLAASDGSPINFFTTEDGIITVTGGSEFSCANVSQIPQSECEALVAIHAANPSAVDLLNGWLDTNTPCNWNRVQCRDGNVVELDFSTIDGGLSVLPPQIGNLTKLESLNLLFSAISSLPAEIGNLTSLTNLNLEGNELTALPPEFGNLTNLESVNLAQNSLTSLPTEIGELGNLSTFILAANNLTTLPREIAKLISLTVLNVNNNPLESQPVQVEVMVEGNGTILRSISGPAPLNGPAGLFYTAGTSIQLYAEPDDGWQYQTASCENAADLLEYEDGIVVELGEQDANCKIVFVQPTASCGPLMQEAEDGTLAGNWQIGNDAAASGGKYIYTEDADPLVGMAQTRSSDVNRHRASYCFGVTTPGTYRILWSVYAEDQQDNSVFYDIPSIQNSNIWEIPVNTSYDAVYATRKNSDIPTQVTLDAGDQIINLFMREDGARIDKIGLILVDEAGPIDPPIPPSGCQPLGQEAEDGTFFGDFGAMDDPNASGGQYVSSIFANSASLNTGMVRAASLRNRNRVDLCATVDEAGDYRIRTRVMAPDHTSNSFFVQVDGGPEDGILYDIFPVDGTYATDYVSQRGGADPVIFTLEPGDHLISFVLRENGARLDSFTLEPVSVQAASIARPSAVELRRNLIAEGETSAQDINIFVPLITR